MRQVLVHNRTRGTVVAQSAGLADSFFARLRGLIGRRALRPGEGLVIRPCSSIHTCFMSFPIEVLFIGEGNRVLVATKPVVPWRIGPIVPAASYVIELPVGAVAASQTAQGDTVELLPCRQADCE